MMAVMRNDLTILQKLLSHKKTDVNLRERSGPTALMLAASRASKDVVTALLAHKGIDVNLTEPYDGTALMMAIKHCRDENIVSALSSHPNIHVNLRFGGHTALERAAMMLGMPYLDTLIAKGADAGALGDGGATTLIRCVFLQTSKGFENYLSELLAEQLNNEHLDVNATIRPRRETALMIAAKMGLTETVAALLTHKEIDVSKENIEGHTALMTAIQQRNELVVIELLKHEGHPTRQPFILFLDSTFHSDPQCNILSLLLRNDAIFAGIVKTICADDSVAMILRNHESFLLSELCKHRDRVREIISSPQNLGLEEAEYQALMSEIHKKEDKQVKHFFQHPLHAFLKDSPSPVMNRYTFFNGDAGKGKVTLEDESNKIVLTV